MTVNKLAHAGFTGSFEVSLEDDCLIGRVLFIDDIITYEGETVAELTANFKAAVDRYLAHCKKTGKLANKPYSGTFNVRIGSELHRAAAIAANDATINLNEFVAQAIQSAVNQRTTSTVVHNHIITFQQESASAPVWTGMATSQELEKYSATTTHH